MLFPPMEFTCMVKQWVRLSTCILNNAQIVSHLIIYHACYPQVFYGYTILMMAVLH